MFCGLCGMTAAALGLAIAAAYGAVDEAGLAVALGLVAVVQLSILIGNWRRLPAIAASPLDELQFSAVAAKRRIVEARAAVREEPVLARAAASPAAGDESTTDDAGAFGEAAETARTGIDLLDRSQLELHLEPVVELAGGSTVYYRANLALTRQDGSRIGPYLLSLSAERGGFAPALDLALFRQICPVIRHLKSRSRRVGVFCQLSPQSLAERVVLDELISFLIANREAAGGMVIEISQEALAALSPPGMEGLAYLAELGATLSLSDARLEGPDPATLVLLGFRFIDLDIARLAGTHGLDGFDEDGEFCGLARRAEQAGLTVIAANVTRAEELERVRRFARLARGSLFSPPRIVRRDLADLPHQAAAA